MRRKGDFNEAADAYRAFLKETTSPRLRAEAEKRLATCEAALGIRAAPPSWIDHEVPRPTPRHRPLRLEALLVGSESLAPWMQACWNNLHSPDCRCQQMSQTGPGSFAFEVPADAVTDGFAYYLEAAGGRGKRPLQSGSPDAPWVPDLEGD